MTGWVLAAALTWAWLCGVLGGIVASKLWGRR